MKGNQAMLGCEADNICNTCIWLYTVGFESGECTGNSLNLH